jgi:hypothetical protein
MRLAAVRPSILLLAVACAVLGGCESVESVGNTVKDRFSAIPPKARTVEGDPRQVYEAARLALGKLGYHFAGGGAAQGRLEGYSRIGEDSDFRSSRQRSISIRLQALDGGKVDVRVQMTEIIEDDSNPSAMPATETPLRDSPAFDVYFDELEHCLAIIKAR